jgi:hypothetical protein
MLPENRTERFRTATESIGRDNATQSARGKKATSIKAFGGDCFRHSGYRGYGTSGYRGGAVRDEPHSG